MQYSCMLTTIDNPYNPFDVDEFRLWFLYDVRNGYNCCGRLDRIANIDSDMMQSEIDIEIERAIDEIVKYDFTNTYIKVKQELDVVE